LAPIMVETIFEAIVKINKLGTSILLVEQNVLYALARLCPSEAAGK
jgi:ABC-type branched-subunit amino acid transport system ATPase component